jgi:hypothetical protein
MLAILLGALVPAALQEPVDVEGQPLAANARRLVEALEFLGAPLESEPRRRLADAGNDAKKVQAVLDPLVFLSLRIGADGALALARGRAAPVFQQAGYVPVLVRVENAPARPGRLRLSSPQSGPVYAGVAELSMKRQNQMPLRENENAKGEDRPLDVELFGAPPLTPELSGLRLEYAVALVYSSRSGVVPALLAFELAGQRAELRVDLDVRPAVPVKLSVLDHDGTPTVGRFVFVDRAGRVHPPQPKRLAPDFFFQRQVYRADGAVVLLPPGELRVTYGRGPEYRDLEKTFAVPREGPAELAVRLERWVNAGEHGFYPGDHHIHAAGCAHYTKPSEGVHAEDMFLQVKGEALNVGCILTWGPSYVYQHRFFSPAPDRVSEPFTVLKYDVEVSGFGSQALGHVCLLNLKDQVYPGSEGTKKWPTWTTPVLRWAKAQGGVVGYAHSASGLQVDPAAAAKRLLARLDADRDGAVGRDEAAKGLLPEDFAAADADGDGRLALPELERSHDRAADRLPNHAIPEMNSVGAMEIGVTVAQGLCDFISAMDTARLPEWNCWYHLLNCGFPVKVSGETDFPCMSSTRVGQGRVYVRLGRVDRVDFAAWCEGLARGRSYVSDGYAHALDFAVGGVRPGEGTVQLAAPGRVRVRATAAFASRRPAEVAYGGAQPPEGARLVGDTVVLHPAAVARSESSRRVEIVVNGLPAAAVEVPADDRPHEIDVEVAVDRSSWIALRHFPELHTNPVDVLVGGRPIRASRRSALWVEGTIEQLWAVRERSISPAEREEARRTFEAARETYRKIAAEAPGE